MSLLQYLCKNCKKEFEELVKTSEDKVICPFCGEMAQRSYSGEMFSATGKITKKCSGKCKTCGGCK
jgi:putative FmdB family regulatory protein